MNIRKHTLIWNQMSSPIGMITLVASQKGLCRLFIGKEAHSVEQLRKSVGGVDLEENRKALLPFIYQLDEYFGQQRRDFDIPVDLQGTPFQKQVWCELQRIPFGETRTYQQVAMAVGSLLAVRAVGGANHRNPLPIVVPCHRVIGKNGTLVGYRGGLSTKQQLLQLEGIQCWLGVKSRK